MILANVVLFLSTTIISAAHLQNDQSSHGYSSSISSDDFNTLVGVVAKTPKGMKACGDSYWSIWDFCVTYCGEYTCYIEADDSSACTGSGSNGKTPTNCKKQADGSYSCKINGKDATCKIEEPVGD